MAWSEELLREAQAIARPGSWEWDIPTNTVSWSDELFRLRDGARRHLRREVVWSESLLRVFGYPAAEAGTTIEDALAWWGGHIHPDERERVVEHFKGVLEGGATEWREEYRFRRADGAWAAVVDRGHVGRGPDGTPTRMIGAMRDVSERQRARREAEAASEAKSRFLSTLSHELRTPLSAVIGVSDLLAAEIWGPLNETQKADLARVRTNAWHLVAIIDEILTFTRSEAGREHVHLDDADVAAIARGVVELLDAEARSRGLELELHGAGAPVVARTDGGKVRQILTNLVGNALKYTDQGRIDVELHHDGERVMLRVRDTGSGIPPEEQERVFDAFYQLDRDPTRVAVGTGLGLTICRRLARLLGGDVTVESAPGQGSTFTVALPRENRLPGAEPG